MKCEKINNFLIEFYYNYINYHKDRCCECKKIIIHTGHCECWYDTWKDK